MMAKISRLYNQIYAYLFGYFWLPCPRCGQMFGGHECGNDTIWITSGSGKSCCKFCETKESSLACEKEFRELVEKEFRKKH